MKYSKLSEVYEDLEKTSAKLKKTDIIADLLKKTPKEMLPEVILLLSGRVFPSWSEQELGVADKLMMKAISRACGVDTKNVIKEFKEIGDFGKVAEEFEKKKKQRILSKRELSVKKVFENLQKISKQTGSGSQERKLNLIAELLAQSSPKEARYIVRTVLQELRIGVAEGIIRDAISKAFNIEKKDVENAWFLNPDYGEIAKVAKEKGEKGLKKIKIELGKPFIVLLAIKSPDLETAMKDAKEPALEYKYDGMRAQIHKKGDKIWVYTRRLENVTKQFPDLVKLCKNSIKVKDCIIEGEVLGVDPKTKKPKPFQYLSQRIQRKYDIEKMIKQIPIQFNLFDIVYLNGKLLFNKKLKERREILKKSVKETKGKFHLSEQLVTKDIKKAEKFYRESLEAGQEGLMVKNLDAYYQPERHVGYWWKVKPTLENLDLVIIGATYGTGKRAGWFGSFALGCRDPKTGKFLECGMMGTGVKEKKTSKSDVTFKDLTKMLKKHVEKEKKNQVEIKPSIVIEVAYEEIQKSPNYKSGYALRFPRFIRLRPDKSIREVDSIERIKNLYNIQKGKA